MGFGERAAVRFVASSTGYIGLQARASDIVGGLSSLSRVLRLVLQSAILGLGAYLTLKGQVTAGVIIAASIASSRALAPVELAIGHWKSFVAARLAYGRLGKTFASLAATAPVTVLPPPKRSLSIEGLALAAPGSQRLILSGVTFSLEAGDALAVIGPNGAGKSTLARAITGVWPPVRGTVRLDGASLDQWRSSDLGAHIGYLPQDVTLFDGTIADNIARMDPDAESTSIIAAAKAADVHTLILALPEGYDTRLGHGHLQLSGGQRQRIALARALYKDPFLIVLDEPNSNLDAEGEAALTRAIRGIRSRGGIAIVIAQRPSTLEAVDKLAVLGQGQLLAHGSKDEVLRRVLTPLKSVS
jgi:ATP-binding cassette subfamily C protein